MTHYIVHVYKSDKAGRQNIWDFQSDEIQQYCCVKEKQLKKLFIFVRGSEQLQKYKGN